MAVNLQMDVNDVALKLNEVRSTLDAVVTLEDPTIRNRVIQRLEEAKVLAEKIGEDRPELDPAPEPEPEPEEPATDE
jgi:hypothetical protein